MTNNVKDFIELHIDLLENSLNDFLLLATSDLSIYDQQNLIEILKSSGFNDVDKSIENILHYMITMELDTLDRDMYLTTFINRYFVGTLNMSMDYVFNYILDNEDEWDNEIHMKNGKYIVYPVGDHR